MNILLPNSHLNTELYLLFENHIKINSIVSCCLLRNWLLNADFVAKISQITDRKRLYHVTDVCKWGVDKDPQIRQIQYFNLQRHKNVQWLRHKESLIHGSCVRTHSFITSLFVIAAAVFVAVSIAVASKTSIVLLITSPMTGWWGYKKQALFREWCVLRLCKCVHISRENFYPCWYQNIDLGGWKGQIQAGFLLLPLWSIADTPTHECTHQVSRGQGTPCTTAHDTRLNP